MFYRAMEQILTHFPQYVNLQKDDGYAPLHVAVANNHPDIAEFLVQQVSDVVGLKLLEDNNGLLAEPRYKL